MDGEINRKSAKYGFERSFLPTDSQSKRDRYFSVTEAGIYQTKTYSAKGNEYIGFWQVLPDGSCLEISEAKAKEILGYEKPVNLSSNSGKIVEECWECGATYTTHGNVEFGNMGCVRCR